MTVHEPRLRVLLTDEIASEGVRVLEESGEIEVDARPGIGASELKSIIAGYDALVVRSRTKVTAELFEAARRLKVVGRAGVGLDNIDVEAAARRGIVVLNSPAGNVISAAEHTFALMLGVVRHIARADASLRRGEWDRSRFRGIELWGKTLGLVGAGRIGTEVAKRARAFGMRVIAYDPYLPAESAASAGIELVGLDVLLRTADVVSIHVPLTQETRRLIGAEELALMKPSAYLVNVARGGVVDESALARALAEGKLAGAALDVFEEEPVPPDHPLLRLENALVVPHLGAATREAQASSGIEVCRAVRDALLARRAQSAAKVS
jgi:D-3-phosphoglycerate dehydrogenase